MKEIGILSVVAERSEEHQTQLNCQSVGSIPGHDTKALNHIFTLNDQDV